jgi:4-amino-4-deoxy-L-arabinose transferase-like glycosyltransferase
VPFTDFLRTTVLLCSGAATALAVVAIAGAHADDNSTLLYVAVGWWAAAALIGLWLGRRPEVTEGIGRLLSSSRATQALPELEPGSIVFNRLWLLIALTVLAGAVAFLLPQVPAVAAGYCLLLALAWRRQSSAVEAIEQRDGVRFWVESTSPFKPTQLVRTPGFRRNEPAHHDVRA